MSQPYAPSMKKNKSKWPTANERPCWRVYGSTVSDGEKPRKAGVWYHGIKSTGESNPDEVTDSWICTPLWIEAIASDGHDMDYGRLLRLKNPHSKEREWCMPMEMLAGSGEDLRRELLSMGLEYSQNHRNKLPDYLFSQKPPRSVIAATQTGWRWIDDKLIFVMPDCVIGHGDAVFQNEQARLGDYASEGSMDGWQTEIGNLCQGNVFLQGAICIALAGPLLHLLHKQSGGFHLIGDSSCGKTTALLAASSVWGNPEQFKKTWRSTSNGLEGNASLRNDTLLVLDEIGEANPQEIGSVVYALANGTGKQRANTKGNARKVKTWRVILLSSGERSLDAVMGENKKQSTAGQQIRLLNIPVSRAYGAFDNLHQFKDGETFSNHLQTVCQKHYGHLGRAWLRCLVEEKEDLGARLGTIKKQFTSETNQEGRAAERFSLIALAGELAIKHNLLTWPEKSAIESALTLFDAWRDYRGKGATEDRQILEGIRNYLENYGDSRFTNIKGGEELDFNPAPENNRLSGGVRSGYWLIEDEEKLFRFNSAGLKEAAKEYDQRRVKVAVEKAGWATTQMKAERVRVAGGVRVYLYPPVAIGSLVEI